MKKQNSITISIRDDDISFFTNIKEVIEAYSNFPYPISFALIPYASPYHYEGFSPYFLSSENKECEWIGKNKELVNGIKSIIQKNGGEIILHGFDHSSIIRRKRILPETMWKDKKRLYRDILTGKDYLESLFETKITCFASPTNAINKKTMEVLSNLKMNFSGIFSFKSFKADRYALLNLFKRYFPRIIYGESLCDILRFNGHSELPIVGITNLKTMKKQYFLCKKHGWNYTIVSHYWQLNQNPSHKEILKDFCDFVVDDGGRIDLISNIFENN